MTLVDDAVSAFRIRGHAGFGALIPRDTCETIRDAIERSRVFGPGIFLSKEEFDADPQRFGVNPRPGRNLLESIAVDRVEGHPALRAFLQRMLGAHYACRMKKVVCSVPSTWIPPWIAEEIANAPNTNLGAYVRPTNRDITWFRGIDFHQDIIDYKGEVAEKITVYVYVSDVTAADSPIFIVPGSHRLGVTVFPHDMKRSGDTTWTYGDGRGRSLALDHEVLVGPVGTVHAWHACVLHGTQPASRARLSLRFVFEKTAGDTGEIDAINAAIEGPLSSTSTEAYRDDRGIVVVRKNTVNDV